MAAAIIMARKNQNEHGHGRHTNRSESIFEIDSDKSANIVIKPEAVYRTGVLQKMVLTTEIVWQEREVTLSHNWLSFSNVGSAKVMDYIPLAEITDVATFGSNPQSSKSKGKNGTKKGYDSQRLSDDEGEHDSDGYALQIVTVPDGHNSGRTYRLKASTFEDCQQWVADIQRYSKEAAAKKQLEDLPGSIDRIRHLATLFYVSDGIQMTVASLIILNFLVNAAAAEILPEEGTRLARTFEDIEIAFTAVFTLELLINLFVNWWKPFFRDSWNVFDLVVISASLLAFAFQDLPGFSLLRLIRVFRVLRVFKKLQSLRRIINALTASVMPMMNAFAVLFLVTAIYAILGVSLYRSHAEVHFGSFSSAMFTMFQVCTLDGWADEVARKLFPADGSLDFGVAAFFVSFVIVVGIVILNVVVAVLLDEFVESVARDREERLELKLKEKRERERSYGSPLDPVLSQLSQFNTSKDLSDRIAKLFQALDIDSKGYLQSDELKAELRKMQFRPVVHLSEEDFELMTHNGTLCKDKGLLTPAEFEVVMRDQLKLYVQRQMAQGMLSAHAAGSQIGDVLFVLKLLMITLEDLKAIALDEVAPEGQPSHAAQGPFGDAFLGSVRSLMSGGGEARSQTRSGRASPTQMRRVGSNTEEAAGDAALHEKLDSVILLLQQRFREPHADRAALGAFTSFSRRRLQGAVEPEEVQGEEAEGGTAEWRGGGDGEAMELVREMRDKLDRFIAAKDAPPKMEVELTEPMVDEGRDWEEAAEEGGGERRGSSGSQDSPLRHQHPAGRHRSFRKPGTTPTAAKGAGLPVLFQALKKVSMAGISHAPDDDPDAPPLDRDRGAAPAGAHRDGPAPS